MSLWFLQQMWLRATDTSTAKCRSAVSTLAQKTKEKEKEKNKELFLFFFISHYLHPFVVSVGFLNLQKDKWAQMFKTFSVFRFFFIVKKKHTGSVYWSKIHSAAVQQTQTCSQNVQWWEEQGVLHSPDSNIIWDYTERGSTRTAYIYRETANNLPPKYTEKVYII